MLALDKSLSKFYWTNVTDLNAPFVGIIEQTRWINKEIYGNKHVVYISSYVTEEDERLKMTSRELLDNYFPYIHHIIDSGIWEAPYTQPIVHKGYRNNIPKIQSDIDNLFVCTMAQIYPNDRQVSNGVEMAIKTVNLIKEKYFKS